MNRLLSKSQKEIQKAAAEFAKGEFDKTFALEMEQNRAFPREIHKKACELGFIGKWDRPDFCVRILTANMVAWAAIFYIR